MRLHPQTYVLTAVTYNHIRLFQRTANAELLIATILRYRDQGRFLLHAFVVMPDHIHVAITPAESVEKAVQLIKGGFSFAIRTQIPRREVWQDGYHAHRIVDAEDCSNQIRYIANNPLRKNYLDYPHVHITGTWVLDPVPFFT